MRRVARARDELALKKKKKKKHDEEDSAAVPFSIGPLAVRVGGCSRTVAACCHSHLGCR